ncbi:MAG: hypothetical protein U9Q81_01910 [Pseudomonadota bacterium]|nr:hypothetical protein [Pseudomonadota bacterium]
MSRMYVACLLLCVSAGAAAFDHTHADWDALLKRHVVLIGDGNGDYRVVFLDYDWGLKRCGTLNGRICPVPR